MHNSCSLRIRTIFNSEHIRASEEAERSFKLSAPEAWGQRLSSLEVPLSLGLAYLSPLPSPESSKLCFSSSRSTLYLLPPSPQTQKLGRGSWPCLLLVSRGWGLRGKDVGPKGAVAPKPELRGE